MVCVGPADEAMQACENIGMVKEGTFWAKPFKAVAAVWPRTLKLGPPQGWDTFWVLGLAQQDR